MGKKINRRDFVKTAAIGGIGMGLAGNVTYLAGKNNQATGRIGIIGLDTSHSTAFTKALNDPATGPEFGGYKVVAAYPKGSNDIESSVIRIPGYIEEVKKLGVEIVNSIEELLPKVDVVLLETNDGRLHLEQALKVLKAGKRMFIDKPIAASLSDAITIFEAAKHYNVPVFSSSSLRFEQVTQEIAGGKLGKVLGADTYSPATIEKTHPDLYWYGVHGVEILFTVMGTGCKTVSRIYTDNTDIAVGVWNDNRTGTFRGTRSGIYDIGGIVFGEKANLTLGKDHGYNPLLVKIVEFFNTGVVPVKPEETLEIYAFMEAAEESKLKKGASIDLESVMLKAKRKVKLSFKN
jgi:Oxidoreductase family, NAD-binding Rossmann fold